MLLELHVSADKSGAF